MLDFCALLYVRRRTATYDVVQRRTLRTTSYVPAHTQPRTQLVEVKCMVLPAAEHSQTALLTRSNEVVVRVWHIHPSHLSREPRSVEVEFVDFEDEKIRQTHKDNY